MSWLDPFSARAHRYHLTFTLWLGFSTSFLTTSQLRGSSWFSTASQPRNLSPWHLSSTVAPSPFTLTWIEIQSRKPRSIRDMAATLSSPSYFERSPGEGTSNFHWCLSQRYR
ncbi:hypothetical protein GGR56DRAFT_616939 [Xylariaceae sp. FL0804]|nr:hypothetical protein GGR56DRAFT_616939 [Xylariaceae sp. FL0804]